MGRKAITPKQIIFELPEVDVLVGKKKVLSCPAAQLL